eukprot:TRINITY_DN1837_c1_g1_i1.p1 TRINITY_DN1837_c1_g1~~TRINITY_DN1837_c1_g1_i1.p1  ORF type:complete len:637 (+),score=90.69 TRINITY_DN1837_c1_g1_i1:23-1933(+)
MNEINEVEEYMKWVEPQFDRVGAFLKRLIPKNAPSSARSSMEDGSWDTGSRWRRSRNPKMSLRSKVGQLMKKHKPKACEQPSDDLTSDDSQRSLDRLASSSFSLADSLRLGCEVQGLHSFKLPQKLQRRENVSDSSSTTSSEVTSEKLERLQHVNIQKWVPETGSALFLPELGFATTIEVLYLVSTLLEVLFATYAAAIFSFEREPSLFEIVLYTFSTSVSIVFIYLHLNLARLIGMELVDSDAVRVRLHYKKDWMVFDVAMAIPLDLLLLFESVILFRILSLGRAVKLFRATTLFKTSNPLHGKRKRLFMSIVWVALMHHSAACLRMIINDENTDMNDYVASLYWAVQTTTSVGYGELETNGSNSRAFATAFMAVGSVFYAWFLSNITIFFTSQDHVEQKQKHLRSVLLSLVNRFQLPVSVQKEVFCFYPFIIGDSATQNINEVLDLFPPYMQSTLGTQIRLKLLRQVPMFKKAEGFIMLALAERLTRVVLEPNTNVIQIGETGKEMFFISSGAVEVVVPVGNKGREKQLVLLKEGSWFGEIAILKETKRTAGVRTVTVCDLFMLTKEDFLIIFKMFPSSEFEKAIILEVERRINAINATFGNDHHSMHLRKSRIHEAKNNIDNLVYGGGKERKI